MINDRVQRVAVFPFFVILFGCSSADVECDTNSDCTDQARPFCDINARYPASGNVPNTCIPTPEQRYCESTEIFCAESTQFTCVKDMFAEELACSRGCNSDNTACSYFDPANNLADTLRAASDAPKVESSLPITIDTDQLTISNGQTIVAPSFAVPAADNGDVALAVFSVNSWNSAAVTVQGRRALAIVSYGDVVIDGEFDIGNSGYFAGNASITCAADWQSSDNIPSGTGGGGQGNAGLGGEGTTGQPGGPSFATTTLSPLRGGCGSRSGGAVQIVSNSQITLSGNLLAMGFGGQSLSGNKFTGGGAGGSVLLEAPNVTLAASIYATGGSGACSGANGSRGLAAEASTPGPVCGGNAGGDGAGQTANGKNATGQAGGGGAVGAVTISTIEGGLTVMATAKTVPAASQRTLVVD